jgi:hypothetical protein
MGALRGSDGPLGSEPLVMRFGRILLPPIRAEHQIGVFHYGIHVVARRLLKLHYFKVGQRHQYLHYWLNEVERTVFCLCQAPSKEAAEAVHREAHGGVADEIVEVKGGK